MCLSYFHWALQPYRPLHHEPVSPTPYVNFNVTPIMSVFLDFFPEMTTVHARFLEESKILHVDVHNHIHGHMLHQCILARLNKRVLHKPLSNVIKYAIAFYHLLFSPLQ